MIPSFILTLLWGICYTVEVSVKAFHASSRSGGTGRRARLKIVFPPGMWVRFPPSALAIIPLVPQLPYKLHGGCGTCVTTFFLKIQCGCSTCCINQNSVSAINAMLCNLAIFCEIPCRWQDRGEIAMRPSRFLLAPRQMRHAYGGRG
jgi:hypothetical protein